MTTSLETFAQQLRDALGSNDEKNGKQKAGEVVAQYLTDPDFIATHLKTRGPDDDVREVLYEDPEMGFCICGHVFSEGQNAAPHDHGPTWAIYGQVTGQTEMTDWTIVDAGSSTEPKQVVQNGAAYLLKPGDTHLYDVGAVHSLRREKPVKTIRIEGENLDRLKRSKIVKQTSR